MEKYITLTTYSKMMSKIFEIPYEKPPHNNIRNQAVKELRLLNLYDNAKTTTITKFKLNTKIFDQKTIKILTQKMHEYLIQNSTISIEIFEKFRTDGKTKRKIKTKPDKLTITQYLDEKIEEYNVQIPRNIYNNMQARIRNEFHRSGIWKKTETIKKERYYCKFIKREDFENINNIIEKYFILNCFNVDVDALVKYQTTKKPTS